MGIRHSSGTARHAVERCLDSQGLANRHEPLPAGSHSSIRATAGRLGKSLDWLVSYANGQRSHQEFVHTTVKFDRDRAQVGESGYSVTLCAESPLIPEVIGMLHGKTALITGGSSGIGLAIAADVRRQADMQSVREQVELAFGSLDILFANAGVAYGTPLASTDEAMIDQLLAVNVKGVYFAVQALVPLMPKGGSIILNTSWLNQIGAPGRSLLSASKAAVRSFARTLSAELLDRQIRVNAVSPGSIATPLHRQAGQTQEAFEAYAAKVGGQVPAGRMGLPEEIAEAVCFLASDRSRYMLGAEMVIDGDRAEL
ncbi:SDR family oxidoreductase [Pseudomonas gingeri]|uniref:SDR family oxidoreductase n=1 Tax=Pseudomonas gingeri TaxID=117681 RepID=UPI00210B266D|nr:SDR family oxidoreductase [Pseudomonas gingeri]